MSNTNLIGFFLLKKGLAFNKIATHLDDLFFTCLVYCLI